MTPTNRRVKIEHYIKKQTTYQFKILNARVDTHNITKLLCHQMKNKLPHCTIPHAKL